jgi:hypothetical protein
MVFHGCRLGKKSEEGGKFVALDSYTGETYKEFKMINSTHSSILIAKDAIYYGGCDKLIRSVKLNFSLFSFAYLIQ